MKAPAARKAGYRLIDHTADLGMVVFAPTEKALYETAGAALFDILAEGIPPGPGPAETLHIRGEDPAERMVNWLRELLYLWAGKGLLVRDIRVTRITEDRLSAAVRVHPYDPKRHGIKTEIKAVTYHRLRVGPTSKGWEAFIIFDV